VFHAIWSGGYAVTVLRRSSPEKPVLIAVGCINYVVPASGWHVLARTTAGLNALAAEKTARQFLQPGIGVVCDECGNA